MRASATSPARANAWPWSIQKAEVSPSEVCAGESALIRVTAKDPLGGNVDVRIDGVVGREVYHQFEGTPGPRLIPVTARASDGTLESLRAQLGALGYPLTIRDWHANSGRTEA